MSVTIGRIQVITEQHQEAVRRSLGGAVEVYRSYFAEMKETFRDRGNEIAATPDPPRRRARGRARAAARPHPGGRARRRRVVGPTRRSSNGPTRRRRRWSPCRPTQGAGEPRLLELTFGISREIYANFLALREASEKEHDLDRLLPLILPRIFRGLGVALVAVLAFATVLGLARRPPRHRPGGRPARRRPSRRRGRSERARGAAGTDELDDLGRAFDRMVAELGEARSRLGLHAEGVGVAGGGAAARARDQEPAHPDPARGSGARLEVSRRRSGVPAPARDRAGDPERGGGRHPASRRRFLRVRQAPQGRAGPGRSGAGRGGLRARPPRVAGGAVGRTNGTRWRRCATGCWSGGVLANLVENAVQAAEGAGRKPEVRIGVALRRRPTAPRACSSTTTAPACRPSRASGSSIPT